jgi:hypothetical protein
VSMRIVSSLRIYCSTCTNSQTLSLTHLQLWGSVCKLSKQERRTRGFTKSLEDQIDRRINVAELVKALELK